MKLLNQEDLEAIRKVPNQFQPVSGRKVSANDDDDDDDDKEESHSISRSQADKGKSHWNRLMENANLISKENNRSTINEKQSRSPAIAIIRSNNRVLPQVEPFYRPRHLPVSNQQQQQHQQFLSQPINDDFLSHSLPNNTDNGIPLTTTSNTTNTNEKKGRSQASNEHPEGPRTPHSRAKNVTRFYPVTKDAPVVKADVSVRISFLHRKEMRYGFDF